MKQYKATIEIYYGNGQSTDKDYIVEAGTKKHAYTRALAEVNQDQSLTPYYKKVKSIEEVA